MCARLMALCSIFQSIASHPSGDALTEQAYGDGSKIPPNSDLVFDVHLLSINGKTCADMQKFEAELEEWVVGKLKVYDEGSDSKIREKYSTRERYEEHPSKQVFKKLRPSLERGSDVLQESSRLVLWCAVALRTFVSNIIFEWSLQFIVRVAFHVRAWYPDLRSHLFSSARAVHRSSKVIITVLAVVAARDAQ